VSNFKINGQFVATAFIETTTDTDMLLQV